MMVKPHDLADTWDKLKEQDGDLTFKGSKGIREYFKKKGVEVTKEEAARELGVGKATIDTYLSSGKLKGDGNGGVDDESVEEYIQKREESKKRSVQNLKPKHIDDYSKDDPNNTEYIVTKGALLEAFKVAQELAYKKGYAACKQDREKRKLTKDDLLKLIAVA